jgi:hypothetical protein
MPASLAGSHVSVDRQATIASNPADVDIDDDWELVSSVLE